MLAINGSIPTGDRAVVDVTTKTLRWLPGALCSTSGDTSTLFAADIGACRISQQPGHHIYSLAPQQVGTMLILTAPIDLKLQIAYASTTLPSAPS
jgi:hypothetical protein